MALPTRLRLALLVLVLTCPVEAAAQASPYVPLDDPFLPLFEHLVNRGDIPDPSPMVRPFRRSQAVAALLAGDSAGTLRDTALARRLQARWQPADTASWYELTARAGAQAYSSGRRDLLHADGSGGTRPYGEFGGVARLGPVVLASRLAAEPRVLDDPDWPGSSSFKVGTHMKEAYALGAFGPGSVFYGQLDRQWGPGGVPGIPVGHQRYPRTDFGFDIGSRTVRFRTFWTDLRDDVDSTDARIHRYFLAHRLDIRLSRRLTVGIWETVVVSGEDREFESTFRNPLAVSVAANTWGLGDESNEMLGADVTWQVAGATTARVQLAIDDINYLDRDDPEAPPDRFGGTLELTGPIGDRLGWGVLGTVVSSLALTTVDTHENYRDGTVGLGRTFPDHWLASAWLSVPVDDRLLLRPDVTVLRQGERRITDPFPEGTDRGDTPVVLTGVVETTWRAGFRLTGRLGPLDLWADGGLHFLANSGHVEGASDTRFEGRLQATLHFDHTGVLP